MGKELANGTLGGGEAALPHGSYSPSHLVTNRAT